ncbi:MAG: hypothetical protein ACR2RA_21195 [Geminicoccaceae bacterium]
MLTAVPFASALSIAGMPFAWAHNNPGFKEVLLLTIDVAAEPMAEHPFTIHSEPFSLDLPKKTIELIWRIADGAGDGVTFGVIQGDAPHAEGLTDGANSRILRGGEIRIVDVDGAEGPFSIDVYANVIDRSAS